jgi:hypothetical protein
MKIKVHGKYIAFYTTINDKLIPDFLHDKCSTEYDVEWENYQIYISGITIIDNVNYWKNFNLDYMIRRLIR